MREFEWDKEKQQTNLRKHGIDFIDAVLVFDDPNRIEANIERGNEQRHVTIGQIYDVELVVVYTMRGKKKRIISARRASRNERKTYQAAKDAG